MLWVLKRTVSMRWFFWAPKTYAKSYGLEKIYKFTLFFFFCLSKPMQAPYITVINNYPILVMGTQKNRLNETVLLSTQNIC